MFFSKHDPDDKESDVLEAFLAQFYENKLPPMEIILNIKPKNLDLLQKALFPNTIKKLFLKFQRKKTKYQ
jgi:excinuclease ABC subunit C